MSKRERRRSGRKSDERRDESLRGKVRELQKELEQKNRIIASLEKMLGSKSSKEDVKLQKKIKKSSDSYPCPSCGKGPLTFSQIWHPTKGDIGIQSCSICGYKDKQ